MNSEAVKYKYLEGVDGGKTFSFRRRIPKTMDTGERDDFEAILPEPVPLHNQKRERDLIAANSVLPDVKKYSSSIKENSLKTSRNQASPSNFADFISQDQNVYFQRKILMQQEQLQKHTAKLAAMKYSTKGLTFLTSEEEKEKESNNDVQDSDLGSDYKMVKSWPQFEKKDIYLKIRNHYDINALQHTRKDESFMSQRKRLWSAIFTNTNKELSQKNKNALRKRRLFADPAYVLHVAILRVKDEQEGLAIKVLKERMPTLNILKKNELKGLVKELFLRALDKKFDNLTILLLENGFPDNVNSAIYGNTWYPRRFPSFLMVAVNCGRIRVVQRMLEVQKRVQLNRGWFNGLVPLMLAQFIDKNLNVSSSISSGSFAMTQLLLKYGADPNRSISYSTYLKFFQFSKKHKMVRSSSPFLSLSLNKNKNSRSRKDIFKNTQLFALDFACIAAKTEPAHLLLSAKSMTDWLKKCELSLLRLDDLEVVVDILKRCPELIKQRDLKGNTPLHYAASLGRVDLIAIYIHFGLTADAMNTFHCTPLHEAASHGHRAAVQYLISQGADCSIKNKQGLTSLQLALRNGISSEELFDFFHSQDTIHKTHLLIGELVDHHMKNGNGNNKDTEEAEVLTDKEKSTASNRLSIQKLLKYPRKLWYNNPFRSQ